MEITSVVLYGSKTWYFTLKGQIEDVCEEGA
jgi:hypothetical protein